MSDKNVTRVDFRTRSIVAPESDESKMFWEELEALDSFSLLELGKTVIRNYDEINARQPEGASLSDEELKATMKYKTIKSFLAPIEYELLEKYIRCSD